jgi:hypothetical protein
MLLIKAYEAGFGKRVVEYKDTGHAFKEMFERLGVACKKNVRRARKSLRKDGMPFRVESPGRRKKASVCHVGECGTRECGRAPRGVKMEDGKRGIISIE